MRFVLFLNYLMCVVFFTGMVAGYFGWVHPAFDSFSAFRLHLAVLTIISGLMLATTNERLGGVSVAAAATVALYTTLSPGILAAEAASEGTARYRLLQINVRFNNPTPKQLLRLIGETRPDVITAQEVTPHWREEFATIKSAYPYQLYCNAHRKIGDVAILSRRPFVEAPTNYCGKGAAIAIQSVNTGGQTIQFASVHLHWPWPFKQPQQLNDMRPVLETLAGNTVLMAGDLNAPRWSQAARTMADHSKTNIVDYSGNTWLAYEFPVAWAKWMGLPIDNLFSAGVEIRSIQSKPSIGSDHLPMLIEFSLPVRSMEEAPEPVTS